MVPVQVGGEHHLALPDIQNAGNDDPHSTQRRQAPVPLQEAGQMVRHPGRNPFRLKGPLRQGDAGVSMDLAPGVHKAQLQHIPVQGHGGAEQTVLLQAQQLGRAAHLAAPLLLPFLEDAAADQVLRHPAHGHDLDSRDLRGLGPGQLPRLMDGG